MDASLAKGFQSTERLRAQFRVEAFNLTNYYFFGRDSNFTTNPTMQTSVPSSPNTAWIGTGYPRQVQLGINVYW